MVIRLYFIRHAKSSWKDAELEDEERPLTKRGKREVKAVARHLRDEGVRFTCRRVSKAVGFARESVVEKRKLYFEGPKKVLQCVQRLPASCRIAAAFGHNPDWTDFILSCRSRPDSFDELPTCGVAVVQFDCDNWRDATWENATVVSITVPDDLPQ
jgi:phosphohistidine phosphatase